MSAAAERVARQIAEAEAADVAALDRLPRCACGAAATAWSPGTGPEEAILGIVLNQGEPTRAWCAACWRKRFTAEAAA